MRKIQKYYPGIDTIEGAGVRLRRIFGFYDVEKLDPFLLLDFFDSINPEDYVRGFPWHPHRGIETITYLLDGELNHGDNLGNHGTITPSGCQWMTAGRGILHQEMPQESKRFLGCQLWLNLPRKDKMTEPAYREITKDDLAIYEDEHVLVKVICGEYQGAKGPVRGTYVEPAYFDVQVYPNQSFIWQIEESKQCFILKLQGELEIGGESMKAHGALLAKGSEVRIDSKRGGRFILIAGEPLNEPIAWRGPIVMNSEEELNQAYQELKDGTFIKK